jgi:hypothetical protein
VAISFAGTVPVLTTSMALGILGAIAHVRVRPRFDRGCPPGVK